MTRLAAALSILPLLVACNPGTGLLGMSYGDWSETTGFGHVGASVVCMAVDGQPAAGGTVSGVVVSEGEVEGEAAALPGCWADVSRVLSVEDAEGALWQVGYRWQRDGVGDLTPAVAATAGEAVVLELRTGASDQAAGFTVSRDGALVYAMESGRGARALQDADLPGIGVREGATLGTLDDDCGTMIPSVLVFETEAEAVEVGPGDDAPLSVTSEASMTLCNIDSYAYEAGSCPEGVGEMSWVLF